MGHHNGGIEATGSSELERLHLVLRVAARSPDDMLGAVVHLVEVDGSLEVLVRGTGEEVEAAVTAQDQARLSDHGRDGRIAEHVVKARAPCDLAQCRHRVIDRTRVDKVQLDTLVTPDFLWRKEMLGTSEAFLVDVCHNDKARPAITVEGIGKGTKAHRARACVDAELATLTDAHVVGVDTHLGVVGGMEGPDRAAHGFGKGRLIVGLPVIDQKAARSKDLLWQDAVGGVSAAELVGVAG